MISKKKESKKSVSGIIKKKSELIKEKDTQDNIQETQDNIQETQDNIPETQDYIPEIQDTKNPRKKKELIKKITNIKSRPKKEATKKVSEKKVSAKKVSEKKVSEKKVSEKKVSEKKVSAKIKKVTIKEPIIEPVEEKEIEYNKEPEYKYSNYLSLHPYRNNIYKKFFLLLQKYNEINIEIDRLQLMAINIEKSIFNSTLSTTSNFNKLHWNDLFQNLYSSKVMKVYTNLNPETYMKNTNLIKRLFNKEFSDIDIVNMTPEEIFPERYKEIFDKLTASLPKVGKVPEQPDGLHRCGYCASQKKEAYKTTYYQLQTRSADESLTTFVQCQCGKRWRY